MLRPQVFLGLFIVVEYSTTELYIDIIYQNITEHDAMKQSEGTHQDGTQEVKKDGKNRKISLR